MNPDLFDGIAVFTRVAEQRSFTAAARELGVTPAAVSGSIKRLEARVGTALLTRTTRSVGLTQAGELFLEKARASIAQAEAAFDAAQRVSDRPSGLLRLSVPNVAKTLVEPIVAGFTTAYPDVQLELVFEDRFVDIVAEGYDAGIRIGEMIAQDMVAVRLTEPSPGAVLGSPAYFAQRGKPVHPSELSGHACINTRLIGGALYSWAFVEPAEHGGQRSFSIDVRGPLIVNNPSSGLAAATESVGLYYTLLISAETPLGEGRLEPCLQSFMPTYPGFFIFFPSRKQMMPKLRAFVNHWHDTAR